MKKLNFSPALSSVNVMLAICMVLMLVPERAEARVRISKEPHASVKAGPVSQGGDTYALFCDGYNTLIAEDANGVTQVYVNDDGGEAIVDEAYRVELAEGMTWDNYTIYGGTTHDKVDQINITMLGGRLSRLNLYSFSDLWPSTNGDVYLNILGGKIDYCYSYGYIAGNIFVGLSNMQYTDWRSPISWTNDKSTIFVNNNCSFTNLRLTASNITTYAGFVAPDASNWKKMIARGNAIVPAGAVVVCDEFEVNDDITIDGIVCTKTWTYSGSKTFSADHLIIMPDIDLGECTASSPYLIYNQTDFLKFQSYVSNGHTEACARLMDDIELTHCLGVIGTSTDPFCGTFDGNRHTIKVAFWNTPEKTGGVFGYTGTGCTIKDLTVKGFMDGSNHFYGGLIGVVSGATTVQNCLVQTQIQSTFSGDNTHGGLVSICTAGLTVCNTLFTGSISNTSGTHCGGMVGWIEKGCKASFTDCAVCASFSLKNTTGSATFGRTGGTVSCSNCYYTCALGSTDNASKIHEYELADGSFCYKLNGSTSSNPTWFQNLDSDPLPVLDPSHGIVYQAGCSAGCYTNTASSGSSHQYIDHTCSICGQPELVDGYYQIANYRALTWFSKHVNAGNTTAQGKLIADIDMHNQLWTPIGLSSNSNTQNAFKGIFDGQGHFISNLKVYRADSYECGLFSRVTQATVQNLIVINADITSTGGIRCGVIAGEAYNATIRNCGTLGNAYISTSNAQKGGIAGEANSSQLYNCYCAYEKLASDTNAPTLDACCEGMSRDQIKSGQACFEANGKQFASPIWTQTIGEDPFPVLSVHRTVYNTYTHCLSQQELYTNDMSKQRDYNHNFAGKNGICIYCGNEAHHYVSDLKVSCRYDDSNLSWLTGYDYSPVCISGTTSPMDFQKGSGSKWYVYLGYKLTTDYNQSVKGVIVRHKSEATWENNVHGFILGFYYKVPSHNSDENLNRGSSDADDIYLYYSKEGYSAITSFETAYAWENFTPSWANNEGLEKVGLETNSSFFDLNKGCGGGTAYIYMGYNTLDFNKLIVIKDEHIEETNCYSSTYSSSTPIGNGYYGYAVAQPGYYPVARMDSIWLDLTQTDDTISFAYYIIDGKNELRLTTKPIQYAKSIPAGIASHTLPADQSTFRLGQTVEFTLEAETFYDITSVTYNGNTLTPDADGKYSFVIERSNDVQVECAVKPLPLKGEWYEIQTPEDLKYLAQYVNSVHTVPYIKARLMNDVDMTGTDYVAMGTKENPFYGTFDGQGHTVKLAIDNNLSYQGLIGFVNGANGRTSEVKNVIIDGSVQCSRYAGLVAGSTKGSLSIKNCGNHATITATYDSSSANAAGIYGVNMDSNTTLTIDNCYNAGTISGVESGGISGWIADGSISNCLNYGKVTGTSADAFARKTESGTITNCYCYRPSGCISASTANVTSDKETDLTSGRFTYLLNQGQDSTVWYQTLGDDLSPTLDKTHLTVKRQQIPAANYTLAKQYGTLCYPSDISIQDKALIAYKEVYKNENGRIYGTPIENGTIAAGTPVILRKNGSENVILDLPACDDLYYNPGNAQTCISGQLVGFLHAEGVIPVGTSSYTYVLQTQTVGGQQKQSFYHVASADITAVNFRCYLDSNISWEPSSESTSRRVVIFDDEATGIHDIEADDEADGEWYNLQGQKVQHRQPGQVYIHSTKHMIMK